MNAIKLAVLACGVALWILTACGPILVVLSTPPMATAWLTHSATAQSAIRPTLSVSPTSTILPPTLSRPATPQSTPPRTATIPRSMMNPTATHPRQTLVVPTVASEGWDTQTLLVEPGRPGRLYALLGERGALFPHSEKRRLLMSDDLGDTWKPFPRGLPIPDLCVANVNLDYAAQDALYASTCQGLFRWNLGKWIKISSYRAEQNRWRPEDLELDAIAF